METSMTPNPVLLSMKWIVPETRDGKRLGDISRYAVDDRYVYRRKSHPLKNYEYYRVPISKVFLLTYWYEIGEALWEPVDVYGIPVAS